MSVIPALLWQDRKWKQENPGKFEGELSWCTQEQTKRPFLKQGRRQGPTLKVGPHICAVTGIHSHSNERASCTHTHTHNYSSVCMCM